ncbi:ASCH domain-containing protein [Humisphaera borealis]|uniref:ASCH domain-containing protein n=1 Tax=Humisphaera borealis TaxID=2807512 RepID=A0A7M2WTK4_9BACT|nr:ASCH domain-containing protein [Humisphaera borealis]QOV88151.1 ASCH domain-containing protein [Humisphaera borealis]
MGLLFFKKPMQQAILAGRKVTTIRRWSRPRVKAGGKAWAQGVGWLAIEAVEVIDLRGMTRRDAQADGLPTLAALRAILRECYPAPGRDGKKWLRIRFRLLDAPPPAAKERRVTGADSEKQKEPRTK